MQLSSNAYIVGFSRSFVILGEVGEDLFDRHSRHPALVLGVAWRFITYVFNMKLLSRNPELRCSKPLLTLRNPHEALGCPWGIQLETSSNS